MAVDVNRTLVLFDIDGTLIHTDGAGIRGMNDAFERLHGIQNALDGVPVAGRTDRSIVVNAFARHGLESTAASLDALRDLYLELLPAELQRGQVSASFGVLPGVVHILQAMAEDERWLVGLLTGNFERGAAIKLGHFDLWRWFRFGAFGDHHVDRRDLVPVALQRAAGVGRASRVVVIGDTPLDVECARAHGAFAIGVTTGPYSEAELESAGADLVVATLADIDLPLVANLPP